MLAASPNPVTDFSDCSVRVSQLFLHYPASEGGHGILALTLHALCLGIATTFIHKTCYQFDQLSAGWQT